MSSGKAWPPRLWHSKPGGNNNFQFWDKPEWTSDVPDPIEYLSFEEHDAIVAELKAQNEELYKIAQEWMHDYDKIKNKYEPMIAVTSGE